MTVASLLCSLAVLVLYSNAASAQEVSYSRVSELVRSGHHQQAIPLIEELLGKAPNDLKVRNLLGIAFIVAGRRTEASVQFKQALKLDPKFLPALKNLAHNELELGLTQSAEEHFSTALKLSPTDPSVHLGVGHVAFLAGSYSTAVEHYEKSEGLHLQDSVGQVRYAASCAAIGKRDKALHALSLLTNEAPAPLHFQAGVIFAQLGKYGEAVRHFEIALAAGVVAPEAAYNLALAHLMNGNADEAIRVSQHAEKQGKPTAELYSLMAQAYEKSGRTKEAFEALRRAIGVNSRDERPYVELIALCLEHENQQLGLEIANIGLAQLPRSSRLHVQRGVLFALDSRSDEALADFRSAIKLSPDAPLGYIAQALQLLRMDQNAEAVKLLRARTKAAPSDALANWMLAEALMKVEAEVGAEAEAVAALERSIQADSRMPQSRVLLGKLMLSRGDSTRAQQELEKALEFDPDNMSATYLLAQVYRKQGRTADAARLFAKVSDAKSDNRDQTDNKTLLRIVRENLSK